MSANKATSVVIADLGLGNLRSVARAVERAGGTATLSNDPDALRKAPKVIVPGQGAFRDTPVPTTVLVAADFLADDWVPPSSLGPE